MAKTISTISTRLIADASGMRSGFSQATNYVRGFAEQIKGIAATIGGAFAGAFVVRQIKESVLGQMEWIDALAKQSDQLGIATETLQGYAHAADLAGISSEQLTLGLKTQQRLVSEAAAGGKSAIDTLAGLGLNAGTLRGMGAAQQFETIIDALSRVKDQTDRTRLAVELFGRSGLGFLSLDSGALKAAAEEIERFGGGISRIDAAKVEQANDAITSMKAAFAAAANELAVNLAPAITSTAQAVTGLAAWIGQLDASTVRSTAEIVGFSLAFGAVLKIIPMVISAIRSIIATLRALATAQAVSSAMAGPAGWLRLAAAAGIAAGAVYAIGTAFDRATENAAAADFSKPFKDATVSVEQAVAAVDTYGEHMKALDRTAESIIEAVRTPEEKYRSQMSDLKEMLLYGKINQEIAARAAAKYRADLGEALGIQKKIKQEQQKPIPGVGAAMFGSTEAFTAIQESARQQTQQVAIENKQLAAQQAANTKLDLIVSNTKERLKLDTVSL